MKHVTFIMSLWMHTIFQPTVYNSAVHIVAYSISIG